MPIDIKLLRVEKSDDPKDAEKVKASQDNIERVKKSQRDRFADETLVDQVIDLDDQWRKANYEMETLQMQFNALNKEIGDKKKASKGQDKCEDLLAKSGEIKASREEKKLLAVELDKQRTNKLGLIGNVLSDKCPVFKDEENNVVTKEWGTVPDIEVDGKTLGKLHHHEIMDLLGIVELERGAKVAGHRAYYLKGMGVLLNQALINYGISQLLKDDYTPLQPPYFMKGEIMHETCQLGDFDENLYQVEGTENKDPLYLIATSEQPISAMHRDEWIEPSDLPHRYGGISSCFRKEAGSHGRDMWGIFRIHQFEKVEQFILCAPDKSWDELDKMIGTSQAFYESLELPYKVIKIVSGGMNDAAALKYDLEAWFPGYKEYRELVSCSNCTDYQSRALRIRYAVKNLPKNEPTPFVHLLNGTLCATQRTLCCIVENYQTAEGLRVPKVLQPFMGGKDFIPYDQKRVKAFQERLVKEEKEAAEKAAKKDKKGGKGGKKAEEKKE